MDLSPLQLEGYYVKKLEFSLRANVEEVSNLSAARGLQYLPSEIGEIDPLTIKLSGGGGPNKEDVSRWRFHLELESDIPDESNYPYDFSLEIVGFFKVFFDEPQGKDEILIRTNATTLLYTTAREIIAATTSRGPYPGALLPAVSFANSPFVEKAKDVSNESLKTKEPKRKSSKPAAKKVTKKKASTRQQPSKIKEGVKNARRSKKEKS